MPYFSCFNTSSEVVIATSNLLVPETSSNKNTPAKDSPTLQLLCGRDDLFHRKRYMEAAEQDESKWQPGRFQHRIGYQRVVLKQSMLVHPLLVLALLDFCSFDLGHVTTMLNHLLVRSVLQRSYFRLTCFPSQDKVNGWQTPV